MKHGNAEGIDDDLAYLARQPVLDAQENIIAYELLFRGKGGKYNAAEIENDVQATARVMANAVHSVGLQKLLGHFPGFLNFNHETFQLKLHELLNKDKFVIEILEHTEVTPVLVAQIKDLQSKGYRFALDDFVFESSVQKFDLLLPYVNLLKIDLTLNDMSLLHSKVQWCKERRLEMLAEKVETREDFELCKMLGFQYYQGYFFAKPEILHGKRMDPQAAGIMELVRLLHKQEEMQTLVHAFERYPEIVVNLLRFVNSASFGFRSPINSIQHALTLVGRNLLHQWLTMMVYAKPGSPVKQNPVFMLATQRAKAMSFLAVDIKDKDINQHEAFLAGIVSLMDTVFKVPLTEIVQEMHLSQKLTEAILFNMGKLGKILKLVTSAIEAQDDLSEHYELLEELKISPEQLGSAALRSYMWVEENF
jgi:c-di-GMP phosphodiesterase